MILDKETLRKRLDHLIWQIEQARISVSEHHIVKLVVVGKYTPLQNILTLYSLGQRAFGENQVQQLSERVAQSEDFPIEWHMIGTLQKNKINRLIELRPTLLQSLDRLELAYALQKRLEAKNQHLSALLQINASREKTKGGVDPDEAIDIYHQITQECPNITLKGVMCIGAHTEDTSKVTQSFEITRKIFDRLPSKEARYCSMGMSSDFELAIRCGSNMVRIGSTLFGDKRS